MIGKNVKNRDLIVKIVKKEDKSTSIPSKIENKNKLNHTIRTKNDK